MGLFRKARARSVEHPERWVESSVALAQLYLELGEPANALDVAETILERDEHSAPGRALRSRALAAGGAGPASGDELERLALDPAATGDELRSWARWLVDHGEPTRALATLDTLVVAYPGDAEARVLRARALIADGRPEPALWALTTLVDEGGAPVEAYRTLAALLLERGRFAEAGARAAEGEAARGADVDLAHLRGEAALELGDLDAARAAFEQERDRRPERPEGWIALGGVELRAGRPDPALRDFEQAAALDPGDWRPWWWIAQAQAAQGRPVPAIEACREALTRKEDVAVVHGLLARLLATAGATTDEVETHARRAVELDPGDAEARRLLRRAGR